MDVGDRLPPVVLTASDGASVPLDTLPLPLVLYFYPKDDTPGCTREAGDFSERMPAFTAAGVSVLGMSQDAPAKHLKFAEKHSLAVPLASDLDGSVLAAFGTWVEKQLYGRRYMGIERATFLFGRDGRVSRVWRKVKVAGHAEEVLAAARALV